MADTKTQDKFEEIWKLRLELMRGYEAEILANKEIVHLLREILKSVNAIVGVLSVVGLAGVVLLFVIASFLSR